MGKKTIKIRIEDLPEDISKLPEDAEIIVSDHEEAMDDSYWED